MRRLFLALDLDELFLRDVLARMGELRRVTEQRVRVRPRWVAPHTLHVTLRFLGDTEEAELPALVDLVTTLGTSVTMPLVVRSTSLLAFPNPKRAHVLALHLEDDGVLVELGKRAENAVRALGRAPEERPFRPHLTLARFRETADLRRLLEAEAAPRAGGRLTALTLYESDLGKEGGPIHTPLARYELP